MDDQLVIELEVGSEEALEIEIAPVTVVQGNVLIVGGGSTVPSFDGIREITRNMDGTYTLLPTESRLRLEFAATTGGVIVSETPKERLSTTPLDIAADTQSTTKSTGYGAQASTSGNDVTISQTGYRQVTVTVYGVALAGQPGVRGGVGPDGPPGVIGQPGAVGQPGRDGTPADPTKLFNITASVSPNEINKTHVPSHFNLLLHTLSLIHI